MRDKTTKSGEQVVNFNSMFTNILKYTTLQKAKISYSSVHQKLQDVLYQLLGGLSNKVMGLKRQVKKKQEKEKKNAVSWMNLI